MCVFDAFENLRASDDAESVEELFRQIDRDAQDLVTPDAPQPLGK